MTDPNTIPCREGGKKHRVESAVLEEARRAALRESGDGSYTVECIDCGKQITKGPTDLNEPSRIIH